VARSLKAWVQSALVRVKQWQQVGTAVDSGRGGWFRILESRTGAWQQNDVPIESQSTLLAFSALYACVTIIANDIAKLYIRVVEEDPATGICTELRDTPFARVLRKPNTYQNRINFITQWVVSKLLHGNAYILLFFDARRMVSSMHVLNAERVTPLVTESGDVYYRLKRDPLARVNEDDMVVHASSMIHDMMTPLWHPLVGVTPIYACAQSTALGRAIQLDSTRSFKNGSRPGGQLTAPGTIDDETAARLKAEFENKFSGENVGRLFVSGDGLKYEAMPTIPAVDAQLIEQLRWTVEDIARCFHVPLFKLGVPLQSGNGSQASLEALNQGYYSDCLQSIIESLELCLDEKLALPKNYYTDFDLDGLLRMDQAAQMAMLSEGVKNSILAPDEARAKLNRKPVPGGASPMAQQQNYSLAALEKRDAQPNPFATNAPPAPAPSQPVEDDEDEDTADVVAELVARIRADIEADLA
jgi:HK97 family phage portal protein